MSATDAGAVAMGADVKDLTKRAVDELPEGEAAEGLDFIRYLRWRREELDQSWFWTEEWQERYREAKPDLTEGRFRDFDDLDDLLAELKSPPGKSVSGCDGLSVSRKTIRGCPRVFSDVWMRS